MAQRSFILTTAQNLTLNFLRNMQAMDDVATRGNQSKEEGMRITVWLRHYVHLLKVSELFIDALKNEGVFYQKTIPILSAK